MIPSKLLKLVEKFQKFEVLKLDFTPQGVVLKDKVSSRWKSISTSGLVKFYREALFYNAYLRFTELNGEAGLKAFFIEGNSVYDMFKSIYSRFSVSKHIDFAFSKLRKKFGSEIIVKTLIYLARTWREDNPFTYKDLDFWCNRVIKLENMLKKLKGFYYGDYMFDIPLFRIKNDDVQNLTHIEVDDALNIITDKLVSVEVYEDNLEICIEISKSKDYERIYLIDKGILYDKVIFCYAFPGIDYITIGVRYKYNQQGANTLGYKIELAKLPLGFNERILSFNRVDVSDIDDNHLFNLIKTHYLKRKFFVCNVSSNFNILKFLSFLSQFIQFYYTSGYIYEQGASLVMDLRNNKYIDEVYSHIYYTLEMAPENFIVFVNFDFHQFNWLKNLFSEYPKLKFAQL